MSVVHETIYAFIDSQNLNLSIQNDVINKKGVLIYKGWKLDFQNFYTYLKDKLRVEEVFLFIGCVLGNEKLYKYLEDTGYNVIYKPTLDYYEDGEKHTKGNVDAELVLWAMKEFPNYSKAIIVSGDGDYHCLVEYLDEQNKLLTILVPNRYRYSSLLRKYFPYMIFVSDLQKKLEKK